MAGSEKSSDDDAGLAKLAAKQGCDGGFHGQAAEKPESPNVKPDAGSVLAAGNGGAGADADGGHAKAESAAAQQEPALPADVKPEEEQAGMAADADRVAEEKPKIGRRISKRKHVAPDHFDPTSGPRDKGRIGPTAKDQEEAKEEGDPDGQPPTKKARPAAKPPGRKRKAAAKPAAGDGGEEDEAGVDVAPTFDEDEGAGDAETLHAGGGSADPESPKRQGGGRGRGRTPGSTGRGRGGGRGRGRGRKGRGRGRSASRETSPADKPAGEAATAGTAAATTPPDATAPAPDTKPADAEAAGTATAPSSAAQDEAKPRASVTGKAAAATATLGTAAEVQPKPAPVKTKLEPPAAAAEQPAAAASPPADTPQKGRPRRLTAEMKAARAQQRQPMQQSSSEDEEAPAARPQSAKAASLGSPVARHRPKGAEDDDPTTKVSRLQANLKLLKEEYDAKVREAEHSANQMIPVLTELEIMDSIGLEQLRVTGIGKTISAIIKLKPPSIRPTTEAANALIKRWKAIAAIAEAAGRAGPAQTPAAAATKPAAGRPSNAPGPAAGLRNAPGAAATAATAAAAAAAAAPAAATAAKGERIGAAGMAERSGDKPAPAGGRKPTGGTRPFVEPKNELPTISTTGDAVRDKAIGMLTMALAPALSPCATARRLEAALHDVHGTDSAGSKGNYIQRLMALYYMLDRESEAHIPALRDKVMMGEMSMYEVVCLQDADAAALAGRPWPPISPAAAADPTAAAEGAANQATPPQLLQQEPAAGQAPDAEDVQQTGPQPSRQPAAALSAVDIGPQLPPGGSYIAEEATAGGPPAATPEPPSGSPPPAAALATPAVEPAAATPAAEASQPAAAVPGPPAPLTAGQAVGMDVDSVAAPPPPPPPPPELCGVPTSATAAVPAQPIPTATDTDALAAAQAADAPSEQAANASVADDGPAGASAADLRGPAPIDAPPSPQPPAPPSEPQPDAEQAGAAAGEVPGPPPPPHASPPENYSEPPAPAARPQQQGAAHQAPQQQPGFAGAVPETSGLQALPADSSVADFNAAAGFMAQGLPAVNTAAGFMSPPGMQPASSQASDAETPGTRFVNSLLVATPSQPQPDSQGDFGLPPSQPNA